MFPIKLGSAGVETGLAALVSQMASAKKVPLSISKYGGVIFLALFVFSCTSTGQAQQPLAPGTQGMVSSNNPLASFAGMQILLEGGNAVDAAIATAAALGSVEPYLSGLGGDGFMLVYQASSGETHLLNFSGRTPKALSTNDFGEEEGLPSNGPLAALIPGAPAGWEAARKRFGTMNSQQLLAPAIKYAEQGYLATPYAAEAHSWAITQFIEWGEIGASAWWGGGFEPPRAGDTIRNQKLANTYSIMAREGFDAFYSGEIADEIVSFVQQHGGVFTKEDMRTLTVQWERPLHTTYRGYDIHTTRPNSSGGLAIAQILNILEGFDLAAYKVNSADYVHLMVEAIKLAAADRAVWSVDPDFLSGEVPFERLLSKEYAAERRTLIDIQRAAPDVDAGVEQPGTSHVSVVDKDGNMVSMTVSLGSGWGSGFVAGETGVVLNNAVYMFEVDPESPGYLEGGKRVQWNMAPTLLAKDGKPFMVLGTPGGTGIWQTLPQVITKVIDYGHGFQRAIESPRFIWKLSGPTVELESRIPNDVVKTLDGRGHEVIQYADWSIAMGGVIGIMIDPETNELIGGADPRRDSYVIGW